MNMGGPTLFAVIVTYYVKIGICVILTLAMPNHYKKSARQCQGC